MGGKILCSVVLLICSGSVFAAETKRTELKDPYFGEALYYAFQGEYFDAIARLDTELKQYYGVDEPQLDSLHFHINQAEFSVGDIELSYRMHRRAGRAIKAVIEGNVADEVRNEAIYRLARIYFQKEQHINALHTIERIEGKVPEAIVNDVAFLKAQIYMATGRFEEAETIFASLEGEKSHVGFSTYNLGVSLFAQKKEEQGTLKLEQAGLLKSDERAALAIRDKANLVLGSRLLEDGKLQTAQQYLERVRLEGPFANRSLLGLGWASVKLEDYERALVPWTYLIKRNVTDPSVQEALIGVPYAYGKLGLYGKAALMYGSALTKISEELDKLDASVESIQQGKFLEALVREEIKQDKNWVIKLRELNNTPETYYLMQLMASHDFQSSLQNYLDLEQLRRKLESWEAYYNSYEEMIALRRQYYEPLLPSIDEQFRKLDSRIRLRFEQRDKIEGRLKTMLVSYRPEYLTTADERIVKEKIVKLEKRAGKDLQYDKKSRHRLERLKGYLHWNISVEYDERLTEAFKNLADLDEKIARLKAIYASFVRTRQAATQSYTGYDEQIRRLRNKTRTALDTVNTLMARQGHMLEVMAVNELIKRRQKLEQFQVKARFAMAESYDRATMKQNQAPQPEVEIKGDQSLTPPGGAVGEEGAAPTESLEAASEQAAPTTPSGTPSEEPKTEPEGQPVGDTGSESKDETAGQGEG